MRNFSIRQKLFLIFAVLTITFVGSGIYNAYSLSSINDGTLRIATGVEKDFNEMIQICQRYKNNSKQIIELAKEGKTSEATKLLEESAADYEKIEVKLNQILDNQKDLINMETSDASEKYNQARIILIVSIILVVMFSILMALGLSTSIMKSIKYLMNVSKELAAGNLTVEAKAETKDEFGKLTEVYAETIETLRKLIERIQQNAKDASTFAAQLNENASRWQLNKWRNQ